MLNDKIALTAALNTAISSFRAANPSPSVLGTSPDQRVLYPLARTIEQCEIYKEVAGKMLFMGGSDSLIRADFLADRLFSKGGWPTENIESAVDWLLKILGTREATVLVKAAIWGLQLNQPVALSETVQLSPFNALPKCHMKDRIETRARESYEGLAWKDPTCYEVPDASYVETVDGFPYIGKSWAALLRRSELEEKLNDTALILQAATVGRPIAVAYWFEFLDDDLDFARWDNILFWHLPEVHPRVERGLIVEGSRIYANFANFAVLPSGRRDDLKRSMDRFRLSQCRRQPIDRVLDLTLAFEIAVSGSGGENSPPGFKVSVRTAQTIGGELPLRQKIRRSVAELYKLRNQATHGGNIRTKNEEYIFTIIDTASKIYINLMKRLLTITTIPNWEDIELEALP